MGRAELCMLTKIEHNPINSSFTISVFILLLDEHNLWYTGNKNLINLN